MRNVILVILMSSIIMNPVASSTTYTWEEGESLLYEVSLLSRTPEVILYETELDEFEIMFLRHRQDNERDDLMVFQYHTISVLLSEFFMGGMHKQSVDVDPSTGISQDMLMNVMFYQINSFHLGKNTAITFQYKFPDEIQVVKEYQVVDYATVNLDSFSIRAVNISIPDFSYIFQKEDLTYGYRFSNLYYLLSQTTGTMISKSFSMKYSSGPKNQMEVNYQLNYSFKLKAHNFSGFQPDIEPGTDMRISDSYILKFDVVAFPLLISVSAIYYISRKNRE